MKHKGNKNSNRIIVALIALCCLGAGCKKAEETTKQTSKASETEATTIPTTEETTTIPTTDETTTEETSSEATEQSTEAETTASEEETTAATKAPVADTISLGAGNITNHGFATGNSLYSFYVTHPSSDQEALTQEENASGEKKKLYTASSIDYLNLQGDALYFRDGRNAISKLNVADGSCEKIYEGEITNLTVYGEYLYFSENSSLVRCGLDGSNKEVLFEEQHSSMPADVAFCITNDKIYFSDPTDFANGGFFFGKVYSMDLDGKNQTDFPSGVIACNGEMFFSDGKCLYFYGTSEDQSVSGYLRINLDGSDLRHVNRNSPTSINTAEGKEYLSVSEGLNLLDADLTPTQILKDSIGDSAHFVIVGENIYYMNLAGTTIRVSLDGTNNVKLG